MRTAASVCSVKARKLIHAIFSRFGLVLVLLVLQFGALFSLMRWFSNLLPHYLGGTLLVTAAMMVYLLIRT